MLNLEWVSLIDDALSCLFSGVSTPKTGLQWQQPFLELVLACMHAQSATHEELLGPLKNQLSTFLAAFDKVRGLSLVGQLLALNQWAILRIMK